MSNIHEDMYEHPAFTTIQCILQQYKAHEVLFVLDSCHELHPCTHCRVIQKVPESVEAFQDAAAKLLADRHHGVLLTGVTLMLEVCAVEPAAVEAYRRHVPSLCKVLRSLLMSGFAPEHDVSGITDPFLQIQVRLAPMHVIILRNLL